MEKAPALKLVNQLSLKPLQQKLFKLTMEQLLSNNSILLQLSLMIQIMLHLSLLQQKLNQLNPMKPRMKRRMPNL